VKTAARQFANSLTAPSFSSPLAAPADLLALHAADPARYPHLLESVAHGPKQARYDILFAFPEESIERRADGTVWNAEASVSGSRFLDVFDHEWRQLRSNFAGDAESRSPFHGGWFVFLGYELIAEIESRLGDMPQSAILPVARATRFRTAIVRDHATGESCIVGEPGTEFRVPQIEQDARAVREISGQFLADLDATVSEEPPERFVASVNRVKAYIAAGDVFQVNLSRSWHAKLNSPVPPAALYDRLRRTNPAPFAGLVTFEDGTAILSTSPERLVDVRRGRITTRPIAGTHPRGRDATEDAAMAQRLIAHPKERAEHVMLIDLERNDLGRLCEAGSVRVQELMGLESYRHVHHIVSEVTGQLRGDVRPADVIRAVFPGGTITGCPKIRCMEIIRELEATPRAAYTGSVGYINRDGSMDLNILIRTLILKRNEASLRAGAGIVADSDPQRELAETRAKARGLLNALGPESAGDA